MTTVQQGPRAVAARLAAEIFSKGDLELFEELLAGEYVNHNIPVRGIPATKDGFRELVKAAQHAFPGLVVHVDDAVDGGEMVVFRDHVRATSNGGFFKVAPNGAASFGSSAPGNEPE